MELQSTLAVVEKKIEKCVREKLLVSLIPNSESYLLSLAKAIARVAETFSFKLEILSNFSNTRIIQ